MLLTSSLLSKRNIYYLSLIVGALYWGVIAPSRYCAQSSLVVEERQNANSTTPVFGQERYILSKDGRALLSAWLRSEAPYRIVNAMGSQPGLYVEPNRILRLLHIGSLRRSGDWSQWETFKSNLQVTDNPQSISIQFESFDSETSFIVLDKIIKSANVYMNKFSRENNTLYKNRSLFSKKFYEEKIRNIQKEVGNAFRITILSEIESLYRKRDQLSRNLTDSELEYAVKKKNYGENAAVLSGITTKIDIMNNYYRKIEDSLAEERHFLPEAILNDVGISTAITNIDGNTTPNFEGGTDVAMPQYKISMISAPERFYQEYGPQRMRSFLITLLVVSILYWIVKD